MLSTATALKFRAKMASCRPDPTGFANVVCTTAKYYRSATGLPLQVLAALWRCRPRQAFLGICALASATFASKLEIVRRQGAA